MFYMYLVRIRTNNIALMCTWKFSLQPMNSQKHKYLFMILIILFCFYFTTLDSNFSVDKVFTDI